MVNKTSTDQFEQAGAQAAEAFGRILNIAAGFSREFAKSATDDSTVSHSHSASWDATREQQEVLREVGEKLRELREAAGYTLDGFADALQRELKNESVVGPQVDAVESGRQAAPADWAQALSSLLGGDVSQLFEQVAGTTSPPPADVDPVLDERVAQLRDIFAGDADLAELSEQEYARLHAFIGASYQQAKAMIR